MVITNCKCECLCKMAEAINCSNSMHLLFYKQAHKSKFLVVCAVCVSLLGYMHMCDIMCIWHMCDTYNCFCFVPNSSIRWCSHGINFSNGDAKFAPHLIQIFPLK